MVDGLGEDSRCFELEAGWPTEANSIGEAEKSCNSVLSLLLIGLLTSRFLGRSFRPHPP